MNGFVDHLCPPLGTAGNNRATANLHNSQITTAPAKPFSSLLCFQQPFPSNGFLQWRFFSFPRSRRYCPANIPQRNSLSTVNSNYWVPGWRPFHTNFVVFPSHADFQLNSITHKPATSCHFTQLNYTAKSKSKLLYDWRFTANQFVFASSPLRVMTREYFFNLTLAVIVRMYHPFWQEDGFVSYAYAWPFVRCTYRIYRMLLKILPLSVQALQSRSWLSYVSYATMVAESLERS
jgi:hypothetical protein